MTKATMTNEELLVRVETLTAELAEAVRAPYGLLREKVRAIKHLIPEPHQAEIGKLLADSWDACDALDTLRAEAGRDRAVRELEALKAAAEAERSSVASDIVLSSAFGLFVCKISQRLEEIAKEGK